MNKSILALALLASASSFAIMAPHGKYLALSCHSLDKKPEMKLDIYGNTQTKETQIVITAEGYAPQTYKNVKVVASSKIGGPVLYSARSMGGQITLSYTPTSAAVKGERLATLASSAYGRTTKTELACSQPMY